MYSPLLYPSGSITSWNNATGYGVANKACDWVWVGVNSGTAIGSSDGGGSTGGETGAANWTERAAISFSIANIPKTSEIIKAIFHFKILQLDARTKLDFYISPVIIDGTVTGSDLYNGISSGSIDVTKDAFQTTEWCSVELSSGAIGYIEQFMGTGTLFTLGIKDSTETTGRTKIGAKTGSDKCYLEVQYDYPGLQKEFLNHDSDNIATVVVTGNKIPRNRPIDFNDNVLLNAAPAIANSTDGVMTGEDKNLLDELVIKDYLGL